MTARARRPRSIAASANTDGSSCAWRCRSAGPGTPGGRGTPAGSPGLQARGSRGPPSPRGGWGVASRSSAARSPLPREWWAARLAGRRASSPRRPRPGARVSAHSDVSGHSTRPDLVRILGLVNIGALATGVLAAPRADVESILVQDGYISAVGGASRTGAGRADVVIDCCGTTVIPGLIDSHCHVVLGDYTPRQKTVDFLDSYVHGGITSVVSAGEGVHAPGRPHDAAAAKAIAIAAAKCFEHFHPNGMKVNAGSVVLEPGLTDDDFAEMALHGVRHAKYGFGGYAHPKDGEPEVRRAQRHGLCVMSHSGGTSIPGSSPIDTDTLMHLRPDVCGHVNGGTSSLDEAGLARLVNESTMALQLVQAGKLPFALYIVGIGPGTAP